VAYEGDGKGYENEDGSVSGESRHDVSDALRAAVDAAGRESGTWFEVDSIQVESVDDPNVGTYKVVIRPTGGSS
jgi:flavin-binding protein dodecin